jgi:hypothetical protein
VLARGDDPPEPPAVLARGDDPPEPPAVLARGDDPPEPPAVLPAVLARGDDPSKSRAEPARVVKDAIEIPLERCSGSETLGLIMVWECMRRKCVVQL